MLKTHVFLHVLRGQVLKTHVFLHVLGGPSAAILGVCWATKVLSKGRKLEHKRDFACSKNVVSRDDAKLVYDLMG